MAKKINVDFEEFETRLRKAGLLGDDEYIYVTFDENRSHRVGVATFEEDEE